MSRDLLFAVVFLIGGHLAFAINTGLTLLDMFLLDLWIVPIGFAAVDFSQRNCQQNKPKDIEGVDKKTL